MFVFLDESGDLGFDWNKKGTSLYFTVTVLICHSANDVTDIKHAVKRTLRNKLNHSKASKKVEELKGTNTTIHVKRYFYGQLSSDYEIYSVTLDKKLIPRGLQTRSEKGRLYNFLARFIIEKTPLKNIQNENVYLVLDKCKNQEEIKEFNQYIRNQLEANIPLEVKLTITHEHSTSNPCLQAVDLFCWGIYRKYTKDDAEWRNIFKDKIKYDEKYWE